MKSAPSKTNNLFSGSTVSQLSVLIVSNNNLHLRQKSKFYETMALWWYDREATNCFNL